MVEQYCDNGFTGTYSGPVFGGENTYGGYSDKIVVSEQYVLRITHEENLAAVAPLLCAGITTDSPLRQWKVGPGQKVGVAGLGGLGHMAVKIARAMGAHVVLFTTSPDKKADALRLGANEVVISKNPDEMSTHANSFDFILNCIAAPHTPCRGSPMWLMARRSLRCDRHAPAASLFHFLVVGIDAFVDVAGRRFHPLVLERIQIVWQLRSGADHGQVGNGHRVIQIRTRH